LVTALACLNQYGPIMCVCVCVCVRLCVSVADGEEMSVDLLTCGICRQQFPLTQFLQFVWHKVIGCDDPRRDDVIMDRPYDVTHSSRQQPQPPPGEDDVSSMTSRTGDIGKLHCTLNCGLRLLIWLQTAAFGCNSLQVMTNM